MMEELKLLIEMVAGLPTITVWVLAGYLLYRLVIIGSIYGVLRLAITKLYDWKVQPRQFKIGRNVISPAVEEQLQIQIQRLARQTSYIHSSDVWVLKKAIDAALIEGKK